METGDKVRQVLNRVLCPKNELSVQQLDKFMRLIIDSNQVRQLIEWIEGTTELWDNIDPKATSFIVALSSELFKKEELFNAHIGCYERLINVVKENQLGNLISSTLVHKSGAEWTKKFLFFVLDQVSQDLTLVEILLEQLLAKNIYVEVNPTICNDKLLLLKQFHQLSSSKTVHTTLTEIKRIINNHVLKDNFEEALDLCGLSLFYWTLVKNSIPDSDNIVFTNEVVALQVVAVRCVSLKLNIKLYGVLVLDSDDPCEEDFMRKIFRLSSQNTVRMGLKLRNALINQPNLVELANKALRSLIQSTKFYTREQGSFIALILIRVLRDLYTFSTEHEGGLDLVRKEEEFIDLLFENLAVLIEEFILTWRDLVETVCVTAAVYKFLKLGPWSKGLVLRAFRLLNMSIKYYMSPNMALLVDTTNGSSLGLLGPVLYNKLSDEEWEVRKAALDVVEIMVRMSEFPSLQKVLMDSDLPNLVVQMSTNDSESFVRATAIKCLQEMIQVEDIWNNVLKSQDLSQKMRNILLNETEGIVRVEAATFMCKAYEHQQFPEETLDKVYDTMIHSSTSDLHWEVKVRALGFWDQVITSQLHNQGMIDGTFPTVTFSKEHRKIVTLTDAEIKKRLVKVLNQLSSIGCLGVLTSAIKDDCDMEVSKTAVNITQRIVELLKKYNIQGEVGAQVSPQPTEHGMSSSTSVSSGISADDVMGSPVSSNPDINEEVIDQIVNSKDVTLLRSVYAPSDYGSVHNYDIQVKKIVTPNEFLIFTQQDLNVIITEKKNWLNGIEDLGSLLDDMLKTYDDDINNMDCY